MNNLDIMSQKLLNVLRQDGELSESQSNYISDLLVKMMNECASELTSVVRPNDVTAPAWIVTISMLLKTLKSRFPNAVPLADHITSCTSCVTLCIPQYGDQ